MVALPLPNVVKISILFFEVVPLRPLHVFHLMLGVHSIMFIQISPENIGAGNA